MQKRCQAWHLSMLPESVSPGWHGRPLAGTLGSSTARRDPNVPAPRTAREGLGLGLGFHKLSITYSGENATQFSDLFLAFFMHA